MKRFLTLCKQYSIRYKIIIIACVLGLLGGVTLGVVGALTTFFVETLIKRIKKDSTLEARIENPFKKNEQFQTEAVADEPFEGALLVAALGVYCTGSAEFSGMQMHKRFSSLYTADWTSLCRIAAHSESLNGDLIVECLGATLLKNQLRDAQYDNFLLLIFTFLSIVEYDWNFERGVKPSEYLAELLHKPMYVQKDEEEDIAKAYELLGVSVGSSIDVVKSAHRSLASLYHPDTMVDLSEEQKKIAAEAFLRIQAAYESILASF